MAEKNQQSASAQSSSGFGSADKLKGWANLAPVSVDFEDSMNQHEVRVAWDRMYKAAKLNKPTEDVQKAFRLAIYVYGVKNGTSREGNYSGEIVMNDGHSFNASVIPVAVGKMNIRKFFRGNALESYDALKESRVIESDTRFVAKVAALGISAECAFATADWLIDCPKFTPRESAAHEAAFVRGLQRARRARNGDTLEEVEHKRGVANLEAQGSFDNTPRGIEF